MVVPPGRLLDIPGVHETRVAPGDLDGAPEAPRPPWDALADAVVWLQRPAGEAVDVLPWPLRRRRMLGLAVGGFLRYRESPVGAYREVLASPGLLRGGLVRLHVPFMAVDSPASLRAGRANWALPKSLVEFSGELAVDDTVVARGDDWWLRASTRAVGPALPITLRFSLAQIAPDGEVLHVGVRLRGQVRPARVTVEMARAASFARWLRPGRHAGVVLTGGRLHLSTAEVVPAS